MKYIEQGMGGMLRNVKGQSAVRDDSLNSNANLLKCDFHMHSKEDWYDYYHIRYTARQLIDEAARQKFNAMSITHHNRVFFSREISDYAKKRGILLIPGAEATIEKRHVLIIDTSNEEISRIRNLEGLSKIKDKSLIIAPHAYHIIDCCLQEKLEEHIKSFHAIEYCHLYMRMMERHPLLLLNGNKKVLKIAAKYKKPIVGTSDCHRLYEVGTSFTLVDSERTKDGIIEAIKKGKVQYRSTPMSYNHFFSRLAGSFIHERMKRSVKKISWKTPDIHHDPHHFYNSAGGR